jgi:addiction module HigA family antidote
MEKLRKPVHPGEVFLQDVLVPLGLTVTIAARMMGITRKALSEFVNEKSSCSPQMALRIAKVTNTSAESWLSMQTKLDLWKARQNEIGQLRKFPGIAV